MSLAHAHDTATHLDGARLLESLPYYGRTAAEVSALFDSIYLSLYKGLGATAGCVLAGSEQFVAEAREWRHRHGGQMFEMWPHAASGLAGLRRRRPRIPGYVDHARAIGTELATLDVVEIVPDPPVTNMMHLHVDISPQSFATAARSVAESDLVWTWSSARPTQHPGRCVVEFTVGDATMDWSVAEVSETIEHLINMARRT